MAKVPTHAEQLTDKAAIERRTQVLHDIGLLVASWNHLELYLEVAIMRATRLSPLHASILLGGLQHKAKVSILYTLLREEGKPEAIRKLKVALGYAKRNALMHGVPASEDGFTKVAFYHRTVGDKYSVV